MSERYEARTVNGDQEFVEIDSDARSVVFRVQSSMPNGSVLIADVEVHLIDAEALLSGALDAVRQTLEQERVRRTISLVSADEAMETEMGGIAWHEGMRAACRNDDGVVHRGRSCNDAIDGAYPTGDLSLVRDDYQLGGRTNGEWDRGCADVLREHGRRLVDSGGV